MAKPVLHIANKNYSSWSLRAWIGMKATGVDFEESLSVFDVEHGNPEFKTFSPTGKVPVLVDGETTIWESLAILEYAAELHPDKGLWPTDRETRGIARAIAHEMHAGFLDLRIACPMNMRRTPSNFPIGEGVQKDIARIEQIWASCLAKSGGPFLFGDFSIADAMYAPVVSRFEVYQLGTPASVRYMDAIRALPAWQQWKSEALAEEWVVSKVEL